MSGHTPGPWYVSAALRIESHQDGYVATVRNGFADADANARLIAAAPDLLDALRMLVSDIANGSLVVEHSDKRATAEDIGRAQAAIAKAEAAS